MKTGLRCSEQGQGLHWDVLATELQIPCRSVVVRRDHRSLLINTLMINIPVTNLPVQAFIWEVHTELCRVGYVEPSLPLQSFCAHSSAADDRVHLTYTISNSTSNNSIQRGGWGVGPGLLIRLLDL